MKQALCVVMCFLVCTVTGGCYDSNEISQLAFIIAVGIDSSDDELYEYTFQAVKPSAFEGESDSDPLVTTTITASSVYTAMDKLNTEISEKCDYSHIKLAVFSENLLQKGADGIFRSLFKTNTFHPNIRVAMAEGKASEYLQNIKIPLDTNPAEYYENIFRESYSPYSPGTRLRDMEKDGPHPKCNILPVVKAGKGEEEKIEKYNTEKSAIIRDYTLKAVTDHKEAFWYKLMTEKNFKGNFHIQIPHTHQKAVVELAKTYGKTKVDFDGKTPVITVNLRFDGSVLWSESEREYIANDEEFVKAVNQKLKDELNEFLQKCSQEYKSDVCQFDKKAKIHYLTLQAWENEDWQGIFEKAQYQINTDVTLRREGVSLK